MTRKSDRDFPKCIEQVGVPRKEGLARMRETLNVAELMGDAKAPGVISISLYDTNHVYLMNISCEEIK